MGLLEKALKQRRVEQKREKEHPLSEEEEPDGVSTTSAGSSHAEDEEGEEHFEDEEGEDEEVGAKGGEADGGAERRGSGVENTEEEEAKPKGGKDIIFSEPLKWVERMALVAGQSLPAGLNPDDDPRREEVFMHHAQASAVQGVKHLEKASVPWRRPADFYAEMYKTDEQMDRIKQSMLKAKVEVEQRVHTRQMKEQRKFGKEVQAEVQRQRAKHKQDMLSKVQEWKKKRGRDKEELDEVLEDHGINLRDRKDKGKHRFAAGAGMRKSLRPGQGKKHKRPGKSIRHKRH